MTNYYLNENSLSFNLSTISILKEYFSGSLVAGRWNKDCISTLNYAMKMLFSGINKLSSQIDKTMHILDTEGCVKDMAVIEFLGNSNRKNAGKDKPYSLKSSVWNTMRKLSENSDGQFIFTLSLLEGRHCVTLMMNKEKHRSSVYWCDRLNGCVKMTKRNLDTYITKMTLSSWEENYIKTGKKLNTDATVWLLKPVKNSSGLIIH
jgi:hypothetical protein